MLGQRLHRLTRLDRNAIIKKLGLGRDGDNHLLDGELIRAIPDRALKMGIPHLLATEIETIELRMRLKPLGPPTPPPKSVKKK